MESPGPGLTTLILPKLVNPAEFLLLEGNFLLILTIKSLGLDPISLMLIVQLKQHLVGGLMLVLKGNRYLKIQHQDLEIIKYHVKLEIYHNILLQDRKNLHIFELDGEIEDMMWCGSNDETILIKTGDGSIYRSRDRGGNWKRLRALMTKQGLEVADES